MDELQFQEEKIKKLLSELQGSFYDIQFYNDTDYYDRAQDWEHEQKLKSLHEAFEFAARRLYNVCLVYFEKKNLNSYIIKFEATMNPFYKTTKDLLSGNYDDDSGHVYSVLAHEYWRFLSPFPAFEYHDNEELVKRSGLVYLENILESTANIIQALGLQPKTETEVYESVKVVCQSAFPNAKFPTQAFITTLTRYVPDILIPSLSCAIEYKYAATDRKLIDTIDQILIDVKGYDKPPQYKLFYAVFYVKPGKITKTRFDVVWKEKEFPENWKPILVFGN